MVETNTYTEQWWGNILERDQLQDRRIREDNITVNLREMGCEDWK
jgi:hypothetical protein